MSHKSVWGLNQNLALANRLSLLSDNSFKIIINYCILYKIAKNEFVASFLLAASSGWTLYAALGVREGGKRKKWKNTVKIFRLHHNPQSWNWPALAVHTSLKEVASWVSNFHADNIRTFWTELGHITREKWKFPDVKIISQSPHGTRR